MAVESAADRAVFVDPADFGIAAEYLPPPGVAQSSANINGVFDEGHFAVDVGAGVTVDSAQLRFTCRTADVPEIAEGAQLIVSNKYYTIRNIQPDGTGMSILVLEEQPSADE